MGKSRSRVAWSLGLLLAIPCGASSQERAPVSADSRPQVVVSAGVASLPRSLVLGCGGTSGNVASAVLGGSLLIPVAGLQVEADVDKYSGQGHTCTPPGILLIGVHTVAGPQTSSNGPVAMGLSVLKPFGTARTWVVGVGGGWTLSSGHVPYLRSLIGIRRGHRVRWGVDLEWDGYAVPWKESTADYQNGQVIAIVSQRSYRKWASGVALRVRVGFPLGGG